MGSIRRVCEPPRHFRERGRALRDIRRTEIESTLEVVRSQHDDDDVQRLVRFDAWAQVGQTVATSFDRIVPACRAAVEPLLNHAILGTQSAR